MKGERSEEKNRKLKEKQRGSVKKKQKLKI